MKQLFLVVILVLFCMFCSSCNTKPMESSGDNETNSDKTLELNDNTSSVESKISGLESANSPTEKMCTFYSEYATSNLTFPQFFYGYPKTIQHAGYSINSKAFILNHIVIVYPVIDILGDSELTDMLNQEILNLMFMGFDSQELADYPGVMMVRNTFAVTYADENCFSLCFYIDESSDRAQTFWYGMTVDLALGKKVALEDLNITREMIERTVQNEKISFSQDLVAIEQLENIETLIENLNLSESSSFF